jgi:hypothetical protein
MIKTDDFKFSLSTPFLVCMPALLIFISVVSAQNQNNSSIQDMRAQIERSVDTAFVYDYDQSKFVPESNKTLLIMGQTVEGISDYLSAFPDEPLPAGWSAYWGVTEFTGIKERFTNETGSSQHHQMLVDQFPNAVIHSAMWMVGNWNIARNTANGLYDKVLKKYARWAKSIKRPIYLRIGYEFDGPHNQLEPKEYLAAYKHVVDLLRKEGVNNIALVWHSYAAPTYKGYDLTAWYPGDEYVDWVDISVFGQAYSKDSFGADTNRVLQFAKAHKKPVMIAESRPIRGIAENNTVSWNEWFVPFFNFIYRKNIKAVCLINENWQDLNIPGIDEWKDGRLSNNKIVSRAWFEETQSDYFLKSSQKLYEQLNFKK